MKSPKLQSSHSSCDVVSEGYAVVVQRRNKEILY